MKFTDLERTEVRADPTAFIERAEADAVGAKTAYETAQRSAEAARDRLSLCSRRMGALQTKLSEKRRQFEEMKTRALASEVEGKDTFDGWTPVTRVEREARHALEAVQFLAVYTSEDAAREVVAAELAAVKAEAVWGEAVGAMLRLRLMAGASVLGADPGATISLTNSLGEPTSLSGKLAKQVERALQVEVPRLEAALQAHDLRVGHNRQTARATLFAL